MKTRGRKAGDGSVAVQGADATAPCAFCWGSMQPGMHRPSRGFPRDTLLILTQPWLGKSAPHPLAGKGGFTAGSPGTGTGTSRGCLTAWPAIGKDLGVSEVLHGAGTVPRRWKGAGDVQQPGKAGCVPHAGSGTVLDEAPALGQGGGERSALVAAPERAVSRGLRG